MYYAHVFLQNFSIIALDEQNGDSLFYFESFRSHSADESVTSKEMGNGWRCASQLCSFRNNFQDMYQQNTSRSKFSETWGVATPSPWHYEAVKFKSTMLRIPWLTSQSLGF